MFLLLFAVTTYGLYCYPRSDSFYQECHKASLYYAKCIPLIINQSTYCSGVDDIN